MCQLVPVPEGTFNACRHTLSTRPPRPADKAQTGECVAPFLNEQLNCRVETFGANEQDVASNSSDEGRHRQSESVFLVPRRAKNEQQSYGYQ